jgi:cobalamin biosynthesis Mg chelatase CobN
MKTLALIWFLLALPARAAEPPNAVFVLHNSQVAPAAFRAFQARIGQGACECFVTGEDLSPDRLKNAKLLFLEHPTIEFLERLKAPALEAIRSGLKVVTDLPEAVERVWEIQLSLPLTRRLVPYFQAGGEENMLGFFLAAYQEAGGPQDLDIPPPRATPNIGVYHPMRRRYSRILPNTSRGIEAQNQSKAH